jgi:hypothetical protein
MKHDLFSPILYHFSNIHNNNPPLTILPSHIDSSSSHDSAATPSIQMSHFTQSLGLYHKQRNYLLRLGPVDEKETYGKSPFLNIYFLENRLLLEISLLLLQVIDDLRSIHVEDIIAKEYQLLKEENNRNNLKTKTKEEYFFVLDTTVQPNLLEFFDDKSLLLEQMAIGENSLKVCFFLPQRFLCFFLCFPVVFSLMLSFLPFLHVLSSSTLFLSYVFVSFLLSYYVIVLLPFLSSDRRFIILQFVEDLIIYLNILYYRIIKFMKTIRFITFLIQEKNIRLVWSN